MASRTHENIVALASVCRNNDISNAFEEINSLFGVTSLAYGLIRCEFTVYATFPMRIAFCELRITGSQVDMDAIMSHTSNVFAFQVNTRDARELEQLFPAYVQVSHLVDQRPFTCYTKLGQQVFRMETLPPFGGTVSKTKEHILQQSRERYSRSRTAVREYLRHII